jgi:extracellular factor (EF) 3-hydroxypalmitic acid methyl ester biosynthesis protein
MSLTQKIHKVKADLLREVRLLQCVKENELAVLVQMGKAVHSEAHSNIVIEGEMSWGLYVVLDGIVGVFKNSKITGEPFDIAHLNPGSSFGEMSLIDDQPRSATVKALTDCQLVYFSKDDFNQFLLSVPGLKDRFYESCVKMLVNRLRELDDNYVTSQFQLWKTALKRESA